MDDVAPKRPYHALSVIPDVDNLIVDALIRGKSIYQLADQLNVSRMAVQRRAWKHEDYLDAIGTSVQAKMELREKELEAADNNVAVTRADRLLGHARWMAERLRADLFGVKGAGGAGVSVQIVIHKPDAAPQVIVNGQEIENADA